jgi:D-arabinitol dehydrogenase (NADP+)
MTPGHEIVGTVAKWGKNVEGWEIGDRCVVDPVMPVSMKFFSIYGLSPQGRESFPEMLV